MPHGVDIAKLWPQNMRKLLENLKNKPQPSSLQKLTPRPKPNLLKNTKCTVILQSSFSEQGKPQNTQVSWKIERFYLLLTRVFGHETF